MADVAKVKPSLAWLWTGIVFMFVGVGSCVGGPALGISQLSSEVQDAPRVAVPGEGTFEFEGGDSGVVFAVAPTQSQLSQIDVTVTEEATGDLVSLENNTDASGSTNGEAWEVVAVFDLEDGTRYLVEAQGPEGTEVGVANLSLATFLAKTFGGLALGAILLLVGLLMAIITAVRRSKNKKAQQPTVPMAPAAGSPYGQPPQAPPGQPGAYGQQPPAPYGQQAPPPYGQQPAAPYGQPAGEPQQYGAPYAPPESAQPAPAPPAPAAPAEYSPPPPPPAAPAEYSPPPPPAAPAEYSPPPAPTPPAAAPADPFAAAPPPPSAPAPADPPPPAAPATEPIGGFGTAEVSEPVSDPLATDPLATDPLATDPPDDDGGWSTPPPPAAPGS